MASKITLTVAGVALLSFASSREPRVEPLDPKRPMATLFPESTLVFVEGAGLSELLEQGRQHPLIARVLASPLGTALGGAGALDAALAPLEPALGVDVLGELAALASSGAALGVAPRASKPVWTLVLRSEDAARTAATLQRALDTAAERAGFPRAFAAPHEEVLGAELWNVGEKLAVARRDGLVVASNDGGFVRDVLALAADADARGLAGSQDFLAAERRASERELLWAWIDLAGARELPFGGGERLAAFASLPARPPVQLLLGPGVAALGTGSALCAWLDLGDDRLALGVQGFDTAEQALLRERVDSAGPPLLAASADDVARAMLHRDLAAVFAHRAELFAPEVLPELAQPLSQLAVLFGGRDLAEDVLPNVSPWIELVAREVAFDERAVPEIRLPALAGLFHLADADTVGPGVTAAFQTLISIANVERAQQAQDPMLLDLVQEGGVSVTRASFLAPREGEGVDVRYNLEPACAQVGDVLVLGTHEALVRDVVRELQTGETRSRTDDREHVSFDAPALARLVAANREALVMNGVLDEGKCYEESEGDIDGLRAVLELLGDADLELEQQGREIELTIEVTLAERSAEAAR